MSQGHNRGSAWRPCETPCTPGEKERGRWCSPSGWACGLTGLVALRAPAADPEAADDAAGVLMRERLAARARLDALNARVAARLAVLRARKAFVRGESS